MKRKIVFGILLLLLVPCCSCVNRAAAWNPEEDAFVKEGMAVEEIEKICAERGINNYPPTDLSEPSGLAGWGAFKYKGKIVLFKYNDSDEYASVSEVEYLDDFVPKDEDFDKIKAGMTFKEVTELVGLPDNTYSGFFHAGYLSNSGRGYRIAFVDNDHEELPWGAVEWVGGTRYGGKRDDTDNSGAVTNEASTDETGAALPDVTEAPGETVPEESDNSGAVTNEASTDETGAALPDVTEAPGEAVPEESAQ